MHSSVGHGPHRRRGRERHWTSPQLLGKWEHDASRRGSRRNDAQCGMIAGNGKLPRAYSCWALVALKIHTPHREICGRWAHVPLLRLRIQRMTLLRRDVSTIMGLRLSDLLKSHLLGTTAKLQISVLSSVLLGHTCHCSERAPSQAVQQHGSLPTLAIFSVISHIPRGRHVHLFQGYCKR